MSAISGFIPKRDRQVSGFTDQSFVEMREAFQDMHTISNEIAEALDVQLNATNDIGRLIRTALASSNTVGCHVEDLVRSSTGVRHAADVMTLESSALGTQILRLDHEVKSFVGFLKAS